MLHATCNHGFQKENQQHSCDVPAWFAEFSAQACLTLVQGSFPICAQVASWGGYSFIINLLPIHCLACIFLGRMNSRLYVAYAPFIVLGTIEAASIPVVGFNAVLMSEHFGSFLAFGVLHAAMGMQYIKVGLPTVHLCAL